MNEPFDTIGDEPIEARIVAWVLGEASAFEAAELERLCEERPELLVFHRRMRTLHGLLLEAESAGLDDSWKLPEEKRKVIEEILGEEKVVRLEPDKEIRIRRSGRRALLAMAACVILSLSIFPFLPREFEGEAIIEIKPPENGKSPLGSLAADKTGGFTPQLFGTEFEKIKSRNSLEKVVDNLDLTDRWGMDKESAIQILKKNITTQNLNGTDLISVRVRNANAEDAKNITAEVAKAYKEYRAEIESRNTDRQLAELNKAVRDQEEKVEERRKVLATIVRTKGIIYKGQDSFYGSPGVNEDQGAQSAMGKRMDDTREEAIKRGRDAQDYVDAKRDFKTDQQLLQQLKLKQVGESISPKVGPDSIRIIDEPQITNHVAIPFFSRTPVAGHVALRGGIDILGGSAYSLKALSPESSQAAASPPTGPVADSSLRDLAKQEAAKELSPAASSPALREELADESSNERAGQSQPQGRTPMNEESTAMLAEAENSVSFAPSEERPMEPVVDLGKAKKALALGNVSGNRRISSKTSASSNFDAFLNSEGYKDEWKSDRGEVAANQPFSSSDGVAHGGGGGKGVGAPSLPQSSNESTRGRVAIESPVFAGGFASKLTESETSRPLDSDSDVSLGLEVAEKTKSGRATTAPRSDSVATANDDRTEADAFSKLDKVNDSAKGKKSEFEGSVNYGAPIADQAQQKRDRALDQPTAGSNGALVSGISELRKAGEERDLGEAKNQPLWKEGDTTQVPLAKIDTEAPDASLEMAQDQPPIITPLESIEEIAAVEEPYSTFSLNISDASFQIAKAALEKGNRPDPAAIKVEQFYNAVDYGDLAPASNESVTATIEQSAHPIIPGRNLVRVALKTAAAGRGALQPLRLTLLVDQSGSMVREDRRAAMANALKQLGGLLTANDHVSVVGFSRESHLLADDLTGDQAAELGDLVNQTASEGGTNLEDAIRLGEQIAARHQIAGEQNRIVLFTDGAANLGNAKPERLAERVKSLRQKGIAFDIAGIGADGLNDRLLSELARNGNGRYYVVGDDKNDSFARQLAGAFRPAAENVKVQVHFNPDRVGRYKLIGFEKDRLKTEDFRNDAVDAAELAAEEAGVAIYQVETLPQGTGEMGEVSVRFRDTAKGEMVERTWTMPFESSTPPFDRAAPGMQLAGLSMLAADKLRGGPLADAIDFKKLSASQSLVKQFYGSSARVADMLHMIDLLK